MSIELENNPPKKRKRPIGIWIICVFYFLSVLGTFFSLHMIFSGLISLGPEEQAFFDSLTLFDHALTVLITFLHLLGAIALFLLRKDSFYVFSGAFVLNMGSTLWQASTKELAEATGGTGVLGIALGLGIGLIICIYVWRLWTKGVLS